MAEDSEQAPRATPADGAAATPRPKPMKRSTVVLLVVVAALVGLRAGGVVDLKLNYDLYQWYERSVSSQVSAQENPPRPLSAQERAHEKSWRQAAVGDARVCYLEKWDRPWTRWIPLVKIGEFKVEREYFITIAGKVMCSGRDEAKMSLSVYGIMLAPTLTDRVTNKDRARFLADMEREARGARGPAPAPAPLIVGPRLGARVTPASRVAQL